MTPRPPIESALRIMPAVNGHEEVLTPAAASFQSASSIPSSPPPLGTLTTSSHVTGLR
jgi:hypothetical protein